MENHPDGGANTRGPAFPRSLAELTDTHRCPNCFATLTVPSRCTACGFPLDAPEASRILTLSTDVAELLRERAGVLDTIRRRDLDAERARTELARADEVRAAEVRAEAARTEAARVEATRAGTFIGGDGPSSASPEVRQLAPGGLPNEQWQPGPSTNVPQYVETPDDGAVRQRAVRQPPPRHEHHGRAVTPAVGAGRPVPGDRRVDQGGEPPCTHVPAPSPPEPRRVNVQLVLLTTGIALLGVAAIVFLTIAWVVFGLLPRAIVTAVVTTGAIVGASWLARLRLRATAEGVAALGALLVVLNAWAIRALDVGGAASSDETRYWGCALLVLTVVFEGWHRLSGLRTPGITASLAVLPGVGLLLASFATPLDTAGQLAVGFAGAAAGALLQTLLRTAPARSAGEGGAAEHAPAAPSSLSRVPADRTEGRRRARSWRSVVASAAESPRGFEFHALTIIGIGAAIATFLVGASSLLLDSAVEIGPAIAPAIWLCTAVTALQTLLLLRRTSPPGAVHLATSTACATVLGLPLGATLLTGVGAPTWVAAGTAVALAFVSPALVEAVRVRSEHRQVFGITRGIALGTSMLAFLHVLVTTPLSFGRSTPVFGAGDPTHSELEWFGPLRPQIAAFDPAALWPWVGAAFGTVAAGFVLARAGRFAALAAWPAAVVSGLLVLAPFRTGHWIPATLGFALVVIAHVAVLLVADRRRARGPAWAGVGIVAWCGLAVSSVSALFLGNVGAGSGVAMTLVVVAGLIVSRSAIHDRDGASGGGRGVVLLRAGLLAAAVVVLWIGSVRFALEWRSPFGPLNADDVVLVALATGTLVSALACFLPRRIVTSIERLVLLGSGAPAAVAVGIATMGLSGAGWIWGTTVPDQVVRPLVALGLLAALAGVLGTRLFLRGTPRGGVELAIASAIDVLAPSATFLLSGALARLAIAPHVLEDPPAVTGAAALVAVATATWSLLERRRTSGEARPGLDATAGVLSLVALVTGGIEGQGPLAVGFLSIGAVALLVAVDRAGLFRSGSIRRHLAWLALPAWSIAWLLFLRSRPEDVAGEVRGLPIGLLHLAAALLIAWRGRPRPDGRARVTPGVLAGIALLLAFAYSVGDVVDAESPLHASLWFVATALMVLAGGILGIPRLGPGLDARVPAPGVDAGAATLGTAPSRVSGDGVPSALVGVGAAGVPVLLGVAAARVSASGSGDVATANAAVWFGGAFLAVVIAVLVPSAGHRLPEHSRIRTVMSAAVAGTGIVALCLTAVSGRPHDPFASTGLLAVALAAVPAVWPRSRAVRPLLVLLPVAGLASAGVNLAWHVGREPVSELLPAVAVAAPVLVAVAALALAFRPAARVPRGARVVGLATAPAALASAVAWIDRVDGLPLLGDVGPGVVAVLAAVAAAALAGRPLSARDRLALDVSAGAVGLIGALVRPDAPAAWIALSLVAVVLATDPTVRDQTRSRRRWLRWSGVGALSLAVPAAIMDAWPDVTLRTVVLVFAAVLVAAGAVAASWRSRAEGPWSGEAFTLFAVGGLAGLTLAAFGIDDSTGGWTLAALFVSAIVLLLASSRLLPIRLRPYGDALAIGAAGSLVLASSMRALVGERAIDAVAWVLPALIALVASAVLMPQRGGRPERVFGRVLALTAIGQASVVGAWICVTDPDGSGSGLLVFVWTALLAAASVVGILRPFVPFDRTSSWFAGAGALLVAFVGLVSGAGRPVELWSVPLAAAALTVGYVSMRRRPELGSWRALSAGLAVLIAPSLLAEFWTQPVWRLVGLGLVAVGVLVWGAVGRLRAPLVLGCAATLSHALMVFWPSEAGRSAVPWWAWLAVTGIMLVILATTYEARDRDRGDGVASRRRLR